MGISQGDLCIAAGVTPKTLSDFERGLTAPYAVTLEKLRKALEETGVVFIDEGASSTKGGGPGVRLNKD